MEDLVQVLRGALDTPNGGGTSTLRPPKFDGSPYLDVDLWLDKFTRYGDHAQLNDPRRLTCLKALLDGPASVWLRSIADQQVLNDYTTFVVAMRTRFAITPAYRFQMRQQLRDRKQQPGESVHKYGNDLARLCQRLGIAEEEHLHTFVQGLIPIIKSHVVCMSPRTLEEARQYASAKASSMSSFESSASKVASVLPDSNSALLKVLQGVQETLVELKEATKQNSAGPSCQLCGALDHQAPRCHTLKPPQLYRTPPPQTQPYQLPYAQGPPQNQPRRKDRSEIQCFRCRQWGHYQRECREQDMGNAWGPTPK